MYEAMAELSPLRILRAARILRAFGRKKLNDLIHKIISSQLCTQKGSQMGRSNASTKSYTLL
jgi:hypothetical protein